MSSIILLGTLFLLVLVLLGLNPDEHRVRESDDANNRAMRAALRNLHPDAIITTADSEYDKWKDQDGSES